MLLRPIISSVVTSLLITSSSFADSDRYKEEAIASIILRNAAKYHIDPELIFTIIGIESDFNPFAIAVETNRESAQTLKRLKSKNINVVTGKTYHSNIYLVSILPKRESDAIFMIELLKRLGFCFDVGLMQINSGNFSLKETKEMLYPHKNIEKGASILASCIKQFKTKIHRIECYNRGAGNLRRAIRQGKDGYAPYWKRYKQRFKREF